MSQGHEWNKHVDAMVTMGELLSGGFEKASQDLVLTYEGTAFCLAGPEQESGDIFCEGTHGWFSCKGVYMEAWIGEDMVWVPLTETGKQLFLEIAREKSLIWARGPGV